MSSETPLGTGKIFVVSSPSGAGKTTLARRVLSETPSLVRSVSMTTRPRRQGEKHGRDYYFVSEKMFLQRQRQNGFLESARVHGALYGTPKKFVIQKLKKGKDVLMVIDVQGALSVKRQYAKAVLIFIAPPSAAVLKQRLIGRKTDAPENIRLRLKIAKEEMKQKILYDYIIVNNRLDKAVRDLRAVIAGESQIIANKPRTKDSAPCQAKK